jgi:alpha-D-xyloside xylohydrolase
LTHNLSSPFDDTLLLSSTHWKAQKSITNGPHFDLFPSGLPKHTKAMSTSKKEFNLTLEGGNLKAAVNTAPKSFNIEFTAGGEVLTTLGWRSVGYIKEKTTALHPKANYVDPSKGKRWMTYQLTLAVGAKVFGLGERFGPFQKNGQVCHNHR